MTPKVFEVPWLWTEHAHCGSAHIWRWPWYRSRVNCLIIALKELLENWTPFDSDNVLSRKAHVIQFICVYWLFKRETPIPMLNVSHLLHVLHLQVPCPSFPMCQKALVHRPSYYCRPLFKEPNSFVCRVEWIKSLCLPLFPSSGWFQNFGRMICYLY